MKEAQGASFFFCKKIPDFCEGGENPLFFVYYAQEFALFDRIFWKAGILTNSGVCAKISSASQTKKGKTNKTRPRRNAKKWKTKRKRDTSFTTL